MGDLNQKIVLITGGSGGLDRALASVFSPQGHRVVITARNQDRLNATAEQISINGGQVLALPCDIVDRDQVKGLADKIATRWGRVQILINNAGIARAVNFADMPHELWDDTLNLKIEDGGSRIDRPSSIVYLRFI